MQNHILEKLYAVLLERKNAKGQKSYVASLYEKGTEKIAEKVLEEAEEFVDEAYFLDESPDDSAIQNNIRSEAADLLFHMMVMLAHHDIPFSDVCAVLEKRFGISGHDEKAARE